MFSGMDATSPIAVAPWYWRLAVYLVRNRYRGGWRLLEITQRLGLLDKVVRIPVLGGSLDVPLHRECNEWWDESYVSSYEAPFVEALVTAAVDFQVSARAAKGIVTVHRLGTLVFAPGANTWQINGWTLGVDRTGPGIAPPTAASNRSHYFKRRSTKSDRARRPKRILFGLSARPQQERSIQTERSRLTGFPRARSALKTTSQSLARLWAV